MNLTGVHLGSYWMGENDVVFLMARELNQVNLIKIVDTKIYNGNPNGWCDEEKLKERRFPVRWINHDKLTRFVTKHKPDYVIINSGGMALTKATAQWLRRRGVISVGIELSDPDVFSDNGKVYAQHFDLFYSNSLYSIKNEYPQEKKYRWLPFAASPMLHRPLPQITKKYDVVIVGHARPDRIRLVRTLRKEFIVATFGLGWGDDSVEVHGIDHVEAINSGKIYLSFAKTYDGYTNVKVGLLEAAACNTCIITSDFEELSQLYTYGLDLVGYEHESALPDIIRYYLENPIARNWIANNSYHRTMREHTWKHRWEGVLNDIKEIRASRSLT